MPGGNIKTQENDELTCGFYPTALFPKVPQLVPLNRLSSSPERQATPIPALVVPQLISQPMVELRPSEEHVRALKACNLFSYRVEGVYNMDVRITIKKYHPTTSNSLVFWRCSGLGAWGGDSCWRNRGKLLHFDGPLHDTSI